MITSKRTDREIRERGRNHRFEARRRKFYLFNPCITCDFDLYSWKMTREERWESCLAKPERER
ncbi:hypothetical protein HYC85_021050 [Camellia sinensis]|uniref:Uncharacterized protein n=1 Tax=Camellia sinensis TaxID=4442 RepID=A0A7J7GGI9_CAMSI|nr:hypothetical protein HYC85_021050 [Camellia sinensis]